MTTSDTPKHHATISTFCQTVNGETEREREIHTSNVSHTNSTVKGHDRQCHRSLLSIHWEYSSLWTKTRLRHTRTGLRCVKEARTATEWRNNLTARKVKKEKRETRMCRLTKTKIEKVNVCGVCVYVRERMEDTLSAQLQMCSVQMDLFLHTVK